MVKYVFIFRKRGVWFLFVAGPTDQIVTWLLHVYIYASEEMECGGLMMTGDMYSYLISALFSCRLA